MTTQNLPGQTDLFDAAAGARLKEIGMAQAAAARSGPLGIAQTLAEMIAKDQGAVNIDLVQERMMRLGYDLGNAAGSVFRGKQWRRVGFTQSARTTNKGRMVSVWSLNS